MPFTVRRATADEANLQTGWTVLIACHPLRAESLAHLRTVLDDERRKLAEIIRRRTLLLAFGKQGLGFHGNAGQEVAYVCEGAVRVVA